MTCVLYFPSIPPNATVDLSFLVVYGYLIKVPEYIVCYSSYVNYENRRKHLRLL